MRFIVLVLAAMLWASSLYAQSVPNGGAITPGQVWTPSQWTNAWQSKLDTQNGTLTNTTLNNPTINGATFPGSTTFNDLSPSGATGTGGGTLRNLGAHFSDTINVMDYGNCVWDSTHDVGPCINAAITEAVALGGRTVMIPAGLFGLATTITQNTRGVHLQGGGLGDKRDNTLPNRWQSVTRLLWIGAADGTMLDVEPNSTMTLYSADVTDIVFDCASLADTCAKFSSVSDSQIRIGVAEPRVVGALLTTQPTLTDAPGMQNNDIWITSRSTNSAYSPTGILFNGDTNSNFNISYNRVWYLGAWYQNGDGIVFGNSDTNLVYDLEAFRQPGGTGSPVVFAPSNYLMPNGNRTSSNLANSNQHVFHVGTAVSVLGYRAGATLTPGGSNTGTGADTPVIKVTNADGDGRHIYFASTSGLGVNMQFNCGGPISGVPNYVAIARLSTDTGIAVEPNYNIGNVLNGTTCTFDYGVTAKAATGIYTITAENATTFDIAAPAGGNSQTGVVVSGGILAFTDIVLPWSGSANTGDTWTIITPHAPHNIQIDGVDSINGIPEPYFGPGVTSASYTIIGNPYPFITPPTALGGLNVSGYSSSFCGNLSPAAPGQSSIVMGLCGGAASGAFEAAIGGLNTSITNGSGSAILGGENNQMTNSSFSFIGGGQSNKITGLQYGRAGGGFTNDNGRTGVDLWGSGDFSTTGDAQTAKAVLRGSGSSSGASIRLTTDGASASLGNCMNAPANSSYGFTAMLIATNKTTPGSSWSATWGGGSVAPHILTHAGGTTLLDGLTTTVAPDATRSVGTTTGINASLARDNSNNCIDAEFVHPTSTDQWDAVLLITSSEVQ